MWKNKSNSETLSLEIKNTLLVFSSTIESLKGISNKASQLAEETENQIKKLTEEKDNLKANEAYADRLVDKLSKLLD